MADFTVDVPTLTGASAAVRDVRARLAAVDCSSRIAAIATAMPDSAVAVVATDAADDVLFFQRKTATDLGLTADALDDTASGYTHSDERSAHRTPHLSPTTTNRLGGRAI